VQVRPATPADAAALSAIYNQGIEERTATFETALCSDETIVAWFDGVHPIVVVTDEDGEVMCFARTSQYSPRECYRGIFEFAIYTDFAHRRRGAGLMAMRELVTQARGAGAWKLVSRVFVDNEPSRMLLAAIGFREVGTHHRHAKLDGRWRDVVVVEKFLAPVGADASVPPPPTRTPRDQVLLSLRSEDVVTRLAALESARSLVGVYRSVDADLLDATVDACFASKLDASARARFVELFRAYAAISPSAARDVDEALFSRLGRMSVARELDAFYEGTFVVRQVVGAAGASRVSDLAIYRPRVLGWMKEAIELPRTMRGWISPGNVTSLLMAVALAGCETDEDKRQVADLAAEGKERHRVEPPASVRPPPVALTPPVEEVAPVVVADVVAEKKPRKRRVADPNRPKRKTRAKSG
jgi:L-amino acid N-acyltransferase YncA